MELYYALLGAFIGAGIGGIISILITIWVEWLRKPRLEFAISANLDLDLGSKSPAQQGQFPLLVLHNKSLPKLLRWLQRNAAMQCRGLISFYHLDGQKIFAHPMLMRWSASPEPLPMQGFLYDGAKVKKMEIFDLSKYSLEEYTDVYPGESPTIDIAAKFDDDKECFGWNNEAYFSKPKWRNPSYKLDEGVYLIKVEVISSGEKCMKLFRLINEGTRKDFRIEPAQKKDQVLA
jgi:hypothetical protein